MIKIIKEGTRKECTCEKCGCVFSYEHEDICHIETHNNETDYIPGIRAGYKSLIVCPQCGNEIVLPGDPPKTMVHNGKGWVEMDRPAFEFLSKEGYEQYRKQINAEIIGALVALDLDFDLIAHYQSEDKLNKVVDLKDIKDIIQQKIEKLEGESDGEVLS